MIDVPELEIVVGVGDFRVAASPVRYLATYGLGSCVAVLVYDWRARTGALLHVMMPDSSVEPSVYKLAHNGRAHVGPCAPDASRRPFAYVDTAVPRMFEAMRGAGMSARRTRCCLVGGAAMTTGPCHFQIGRRNLIALREALSRQGLLIDHEETGGGDSRSVRLDLRTGGVSMRKGAMPEFVLAPPSIGGLALDGGGARKPK